MRSWEGFKEVSRDPRPYLLYVALLLLAGGILRSHGDSLRVTLHWLGVYAGILIGFELFGWVYAFLFAPRRRR